MTGVSKRNLVIAGAGVLCLVVLGVIIGAAAQTRFRRTAGAPTGCRGGAG